MRADGIVIDPPGFDNAASLAETVEQVLVETFVPQPAIERFHKRILRRLSGRNVVPFDPGLLDPFQDCVTGQLRAVVRDDHLRTAALVDQPRELPGDADARQRDIDNRRQGLACKVIDHTERPEPPAITQGIGDEVEAPSLVRSLGKVHRAAGADRALAAAPALHGETLLLVDPEDLLVVGAQPLPVEQYPQPAVTEPAAYRSQRSQTLPHGRVIARLFLILER